MFHVSFRYIFGIPPLILVLLPVASSDCDIEGKDGGAYQNVLMVNINDLHTFTNIRSDVQVSKDAASALYIKWHKKMGLCFLVFVPLSSLAEDFAHWPVDSMIDFDSNCLNNEPNFFKKHSCDDNKEASFLYRAARKLKQFLKMNISDDFNLHLSTVSQGTLTLLNCTNKGKGRKSTSLGEAQPTKNLEENKSLKEQKKQNDLCFLKILLQKIKTCWNKILRGAKEH
ncbi:interleukin-7 isoform X1 [Neophocaena asiaeorientalis asiaeorientalis]|uniref:Interleukin-7 n=1 Tax=Neophocaena asiaeorientalis asiaeorientalis TaxID=1706337 RepID=A0A341BYR1_NEOAA|nr:interleukin-7 isoform X1 [Neophocaena asiaeorientalis asiaeorientalis]